MKHIRYSIACALGLFISWVSRVFRYGAGATWPGEIALAIYPSILTHLAKRIRKGVIFVAGTNGKTTTSLMISGIVKEYGDSVLHNTSGANLLNGIVSSFFVTWRRVDFAVFEVDENSLPVVLRFIRPNVIVLLNLFRDQLDRYGELDAIASGWKAALLPLDGATTIIANGDDPTIVAITEGIRARTLYIGLEDQKYYLPKMQHATDAIYCPKCGSRLTFGGVYFSHLGKWACGSCGFTHPDIFITASDYKSPLEGIYNIYNAIAAAAVGRVLYTDSSKIQQGLHAFRPAFGRLEDIQYQGRHIRMLLSKNPTGFNESLRTALESDKKGPIVFLLNDRIPDGKDISWIWDVDFEQLHEFHNKIIVSGDRSYDMAVRVLYAIGEKGSVENVIENDDLEKTLHVATKLASDSDTIWVLATYSAMLEARQILTGKKIL